MKVNYISICNSNEISNAFNEYSSTIGPRLAREIPLTSHEMSIYLNNIRPTTTSVVLTHLNRLSKTKAIGLGNISARLVRECADIISSPLCDLFNKSLMSDYWIFTSWLLNICQSDSVVWKRRFILFKQLPTYLSHFRSRQCSRGLCRISYTTS